MKRFNVIAFLICFTLFAGEARAESAFSFYTGAASAETARLSVSTPNPAGRLFEEDLSLSTDPVLGFRFTQWSGPSPWFGFSMSLTHFEAESGLADMSVDTISVPLLIRKMINVSEQYPNGRFRPYAGLGLIVVMGDVTTPYVYEDIEGFGYEVKLGMDYMVNQRFSVFAEAVYTDASIISAEEGSQDTCYLAWCAYVSDSEEIEMDLGMSYLLLGVSRWF